MIMVPINPAAEIYLGIPGYIFSWLIFLGGISLFSFVLYRRFLLIRTGQADPRFSSIGKRVIDFIVFGIFQKRQPRYFWAGLIHIIIFSGFIVLALRSIDLVTRGLNAPILQPLIEGGFGRFYNPIRDIFELLVLGACISAILRRAIGRPQRYEGGHRSEAYFVLGLISLLMVTEILYEGSAFLFIKPAQTEGGWLSATRLGASLLQGADTQVLSFVNHSSYWLHILTFFFFLNFLPLGKHFHIITGLPNVFFRKLTKGSIKPARWDVENIEELEILGVERLEDFTWKNILDLYSCTECGRCSDKCPANSIGMPLSPKMVTMKLRDHAYDKYPVMRFRAEGRRAGDGTPIVGGVITKEEIWSCTTCGACEEECPLFIEYIDKIIDMRRHLVETAQNPKEFNQVLMNFEKTGNPFGKPAAKRAVCAKVIDEVRGRVLKKGDEVDVLYFVDSYGSYDPRVQAISSAIVKGLSLAGIDFGILGPLERDSGHQVRRMGEEGLFHLLVEENMETLKRIRFKRIITTDPHAFNTLRKDYPEAFEVVHYSRFFLYLVENGRLRPSKALKGDDIYTYHDPCYLGRHNESYEEPRRLLRAIKGLNLVEMERSRDRSFCCGGGDVMLWHEIEHEEMRMAEKRIGMATEAGANVIVTACPFCLIHFEDAIKTGGFEDEIRVMDLAELFVSTLQPS